MYIVAFRSVNVHFTGMRFFFSFLFLLVNYSCCHHSYQVAKASFQRNNDPLDAALFYLAMKKKTVVWGLYRCELFHFTFCEL